MSRSYCYWWIWRTLKLSTGPKSVLGVLISLTFRDDNLMAIRYFKVQFWLTRFNSSLRFMMSNFLYTCSKSNGGLGHVFNLSPFATQPYNAYLQVNASKELLSTLNFLLYYDFVCWKVFRVKVIGYKIQLYRIEVMWLTAINSIVLKVVKRDITFHALCETIKILRIFHSYKLSLLY